MIENPPAPPSGLKRDGRRLWQNVLAEFELAESERAILHRACITADSIARLDWVVARDGLSLDGKTHPALVESRLQSQLLARLLVALRMPTEDEDARPQYRGPRGFYRPARVARSTHPPGQIRVVK